ncbi:cytidylyltransferase domain-containing protein [Cohnella suwonensis]|uniref:Cytidylyltransferase domain-containing protein n=1 Tax=Cohnella suwonensis TaxID=696072 RepID=A0ABW0LXR9_9BACL
MKTILIIQARMGSTRLPGKVLHSLGDTVILDYVVGRCKQIRNVDEVIVATSTLEQDQAIVDWCCDHGVACFRGSEDDVLSRYVKCAESYRPDYVIRVTSDCPFIDYELGNAMMEEMKRSLADVAILEGDLPRGLPMELISYRALKFIDKHGHEARHREHVTYYAYEYSEQFQVMKLQLPEGLRHPDLRITLDTSEDYEMLTRVADRFRGDPLVSSREVIRYLLDHPEVARINAHIQQKPVI